jgi:rhomboid-like protein
MNTRIFQACHKVDALAVKLAQGSFRQYSVSPLPLQKQDITKFRGKLSRMPWLLYTSRASVRTFVSRRIITRFDELPENYSDGRGLDYAEKPLSQAEVDQIFGKNVIDARSADRALRVLHGRRVAGTMGDPALSATNPFGETVLKKGLAWLRENAPVDEIQSEGLRAEQELAEMEEQVVSEAQRLGLYKRNSVTTKKASKNKGIHTPNSGTGKSVYGESGLDQIRKAREKKLDEEDAAAAARQRQMNEIQYKTGTLETLGGKAQVELRRPGENAKLKYYLERAKILPDKPPEWSKFRRLFPSALLTVAVILSSIVFVQVYKPPKQADRMWPDMPPAAATILSLILINTFIYALWHFPPAYRMLNKYFMYYPGLPRPLGLLGSVFSHQTISHLGVNMAVLWFAGWRLHDEIGRANFLAVYMSAGMLGSFVSLTSWVLRNSFVSSSLGASGAISGVIACYLMLIGNEKVTLFGIFPPEGWPSMSALTFLMLMISLDIFGLSKHNKIITADHWAHLGGYGGGIAAAQLLNMRAKRKREMEMERRKNLGIVDKIKEGRL